MACAFMHCSWLAVSNLQLLPVQVLLVCTILLSIPSTLYLLFEVGLAGANVCSHC